MWLSVSNSKFVYRIAMKLCGTVYIVKIALKTRGQGQENSES